MAPSGVDVLECGSCLKEIMQKDSFIKCSGVCGLLFHKPCTNLGRKEITLLLETRNLKWFCESCNVSTSVFLNLFKSLEKTIDDLQKTVRNQSEKIDQQSDKIVLLEKYVYNINENYANKNNSHLEQEKTSSVQQLKQNPKGGKQMWNPHTEINHENNNIGSSSSNQINQEKTNTHKKNEKNVDNGKDRDNEFTVVQYKNRQKRKETKFIQGTNESSTLRASERNAWIYATNMHKDLTEEEVTDMLSKICVAKCEKLHLWHSKKYSSFRICVPFDEKDKILDGKMWPKGALLNRYFFPKARKEEKKSENSQQEDFLNRTIIETNLT